MFAVIEDGSHQYKVTTGDRLAIDYRDGVQKGDTLTFDRVLLLNDGRENRIGHPCVEDAVVEAVVVNPLVKGPKLEIQKFRRRKNSRRHTGHRQKYTEIEITALVLEGNRLVAEPEEEQTEQQAASTDQAPGGEESTAPEAQPTAERTDAVAEDKLEATAGAAEQPAEEAATDAGDESSGPDAASESDQA